MMIKPAFQTLLASLAIIVIFNLFSCSPLNNGGEDNSKKISKIRVRESNNSTIVTFAYDGLGRIIDAIITSDSGVSHASYSYSASKIETVVVITQEEEMAKIKNTINLVDGKPSTSVAEIIDENGSSREVSTYVYQYDSEGFLVAIHSITEMEGVNVVMDVTYSWWNGNIDTILAKTTYSLFSMSTLTQTKQTIDYGSDRNTLGRLWGIIIEGEVDIISQLSVKNLPVSYVIDNDKTVILTYQFDNDGYPIRVDRSDGTRIDFIYE